MLRRPSQGFVEINRIELIDAIENHDRDFHALLPTFLDEEIRHATRRHPVDRPNLGRLGTVLDLPLGCRNVGSENAFLAPATRLGVRPGVASLRWAECSARRRARQGDGRSVR
jgi:hypothetical protein